MHTITLVSHCHTMSSFVAPRASPFRGELTTHHPSELQLRSRVAPRPSPPSLLLTLIPHCSSTALIAATSVPRGAVVNRVAGYTALPQRGCRITWG